jgi:hypothetical protein
MSRRLGLRLLRPPILAHRLSRQSLPLHDRPTPHHTRTSKGKQISPRMYPVRSPLTHSLTRSVQELYEDYAGFANGEKLTYKTDVFGIGQLMWNMLMNFSEWYGEPFYDNDGTAGAYVVNGVPYDNYQLSKEAGLFLTGNTPYEASSYYSDDLKDLVRRCLRYRQEPLNDAAQRVIASRTSSPYHWPQPLAPCFRTPYPQQAASSDPACSSSRRTSAVELEQPRTVLQLTNTASSPGRLG